MPLDNTDLYHIAWVVENLELSMNAFGSTGLQWAKPTIRTVRIKTPTTEITEFSIFVTYSIHDPLHVELIQKCVGSPWDHVPHGGPHHLGWWAHDFKNQLKLSSAKVTNLNRGWSTQMINLLALHTY